MKNEDLILPAQAGCNALYDELGEAINRMEVDESGMMLFQDRNFWWKMAAFKYKEGDRDGNLLCAEAAGRSLAGAIASRVEDKPFYTKVLPNDGIDSPSINVRREGLFMRVKQTEEAVVTFEVFFYLKNGN